MTKNENNVVRIDRPVTLNKGNISAAVHTVNNVDGYADALRANIYAYLRRMSARDLKADLYKREVTSETNKRFTALVKRVTFTSTGEREDKDYSGTNLTRISRMAIAYGEDLATPYGNEDQRAAWTMLASKFGRKAVAEYLVGEDRTTEGLLAVMADAPAVAPVEPDGEDGEDGEDGDGDGTPPADPRGTMTYERADDLLTSIMDASGSWSVEDRERLIKRLHAVAEHVSQRTAEAVAATAATA